MILLQLISLFVLISLLNGFSSTNNNSNSVSHNKYILKIGKFEERITKKHEIDFFQFTSTKSVIFHMKQTKGNMIFNGYFTKSFSTFSISEQQFTYLRYLGNFDNPILLNDYSFLRVLLNEENKPENEEQYVLIAYCVDSFDCEYSIGFSSSSEELSLYGEQKVYSFSDTVLTTTYQYQFDGSSILENSTLMVKFYLFNGKSSFSIMMDGEEIQGENISFHSKDIMTIPIKKDSQKHTVNINIEQKLSSFYGLQIHILENNIEEIEEITVESGYTLTNEIRLNKYKKFVIDRNKVRNDLLFVIKSNNCILKIEKEENEKRELITKDLFYQTIYSISDMYSIL